MDFLSSPFYIVPWTIIFLLVILYPWIFNPDKKKTVSFLRIHLPLVFLAAAVVVAMLSSRTIEVSLVEGERISLNEIYGRMGLKADSNDSLELIKFEVLKYEGNSKAVKSYVSTVRIISGLQEMHRTIEVNNPLTAGGLVFYQKNWSLGIIEIGFYLNKKYYTFNTFNEVELPGAGKFRIRPVGMEDGLVYAWQIFSASGEVVLEGLTAKHVPHPALLKYNFSIERENYKLVSVFQVYYKPFNFLAAIGAGFFLVFLLIEFWIPDFIDRLGHKK